MKMTKAEQMIHIIDEAKTVEEVLEEVSRVGWEMTLDPVLSAAEAATVIKHAASKLVFDCSFDLTPYS
jgi:hydroxymethylpyrimidine/phosphomethylpyrimidine kinase